MLKLNWPEYRAKSVANMPCAICGGPGEHFHHEPPRSQGGDDYRGYVICFDCHHERHHIIGSSEVFHAKYGKDPRELTDHNLRSFLFLWHEERPKVKVPKRKQQVVEKDTGGRWDKPIPNSKPRGSKRKYGRIEK